MKWYHKSPFFFWGKKKQWLSHFYRYFQKNPTKVCDLFAMQNSFIHRYYRMKTQTKQKDHMKLHLKFVKSEIYFVSIMKYRKLISMTEKCMWYSVTFQRNLLSSGFLRRGIYINPKGGQEGGGIKVSHWSGVDCPFSQNHARVTKILDFVSSYHTVHCCMNYLRIL